MPIQIQIKRPLTKKTKDLDQERYFSLIAKQAKTMGEVANKLSQSLEEIKRCAKALSIAISAAKKERTDEKKEKHLKKINALIEKYNNANDIHKELCSKELNKENNPMVIWDDKEEEYTLEDLK